MKTTLTISATHRVGGILMALAMTLAAAPVFAQSATVTLEARDVDLTYPAEAVVEAVRSATVAAQIQGRVVEVRADAGKRVKQGEVLMRIDGREFAENAAAAQAQSIQAKANYERVKNLYAQKFVSSAALDKAEADYKSAQATAGASGANYSHASITAPMSGIVAQRLTELGEMATPGKPLIVIYEPKGLRVIASIPQYKLAEVKKGLRARLEFPETGLWVDAVRVEILPTADARSHTVTARLYLPDNVAGVIPGMAARAHFVMGRAKKMTVPPAAVLRRGEVTAVYVIDAQEQPHLRQVRLGEIVGNGEIEVLAGLSGGERVSLDPIKAGMQLKQQPAVK
jgi:RND family efflux transporter MFP subunit